MYASKRFPPEFSRLSQRLPKTNIFQVFQDCGNPALLSPIHPPALSDLCLNKHKKWKKPLEATAVFKQAKEKKRRF